MNPEEARYAALRKFGWVENIKVACRDQCRVRWIEDLLLDMRFGLRMLAKHRGFTTVAVVTLAMGVGTSAALFSVVNTFLIAPLPLTDSARLIDLRERRIDRPGEASPGVSPQVFQQMLAQTNVFKEIAAAQHAGYAYFNGEYSEEVSGYEVTPNLFSWLRMSAWLGRTFVPGEGRPGSPQVVILRHGFWQRCFGSDTGIVGRTILLNNQAHVVVGVMPPHFRFPWWRWGGQCDFWIPFDLAAANPVTLSVGPSWRVFGRLRSELSVAQAESALTAIAQRNEQADPSVYRNVRIQMRPLSAMFTGETFQRTILGLMVGIGFVLLIACANLATLFMAQAETRRKELATRAAAGASAFRLRRQLTTESVMLCLIGGSLGLLLAFWGVHLLEPLVPEGIPRLKSIRLDWTVVGFALLLCLSAGISLGFAPSLKGVRSDLNGILKEGGGTVAPGAERVRTRGALMVIELALAMVLLTGAALMIQSVVRLLHVNPGFEPKNLLLFQVARPIGPHDTGLQELTPAFLDSLTMRLRSLPGVVSIGLERFGIGENFVPEDQTKPFKASGLVVSVGESDLFRTLRVPLLAGRYLSDADASGGSERNIIVNETMARQLGFGQGAVGKRLRSAKDDRIYHVIGVVSNLKTFALDSDTTPKFYMVYSGSGQSYSARVWLRMDTNPALLIQTIRRAVSQLDPTLWPLWFTFPEQTLARSAQPRRTYMLFLSTFAVVGLALAVIGIYGVLSYSVVRRTREIGLRMALGAEPVAVVRLVVGQGIPVILVGILLGMLGAFALTRLLGHLLFGVSPTDPAIFAGVTLLLTVVAVLACYLPARRASRIDPAVSLRHE